MQRRKGNQSPQVSEKLRIHSLRGYVVGATMDDAVPSSCWPRKTQVPGRGGNSLCRRSVIREIAVDIYQRIVVRTPNPKMSAGQADVLHRAAGELHFLQLS